MLTFHRSITFFNMLGTFYTLLVNMFEKLLTHLFKTKVVYIRVICHLENMS